MSEDLKCPHCGEVAEDDWELDAYHRGCRLGALFPEARTELGDGLVSFDMSKIREKLGMRSKARKRPPNREKP